MAGRLILGLGNPGRRYDDTRHNIGFRVIDRLCGELGVRGLRETLPTAVYGVGEFEGERVLLAKPTTYMNKSGAAARQFREIEEIDPADMIVICDDTNISLGTLRVRPKGSAGGHNGLKSIIQILGTPDFGRIRCGVGAPADRNYPLEDYVLDSFTKNEEEYVEVMIGLAGEAALSVCREGYETAMSRYNRRQTEE